jgi:hypothetical protein
MDDKERQIRLAQRAKEILADDVVVEARRYVREELRDAWEKTKPTDAASRESIYMALKVFDRVWLRVETVLGDGKVIDSTLAEHERRGLLNF